MKKPSDGTGPPEGFAVEFSASWQHWARHRTDAELAEIAISLKQLQDSFGKPHVHSGLGLRRLSPRLFEFRISSGIRVVFAFIKPRAIRLAMTGNHDEVRAWLKASALR